MDFWNKIIFLFLPEETIRMKCQTIFGKKKKKRWNDNTHTIVGRADDTNAYTKFGENL